MVLAGYAVTGGSTPAQGPVTASGFVSLAEHRVDAGYGVERSTGALVGAVATLRISPRFEFAVRAQGGTLNASGGGAIDRDVGEIGADARWLVGSWLVLQAGAARRVYSTLLARQGWTTAGAGAEVRLPLLENGLSGVLRASLLPVVSVSGTRGPDVGVLAAAGISYHWPTLGVSALYSLERYDFPRRGSVQRLEQVSALTLQFDITPGKRSR
jgi:hypothetical protein